MIGRLRGIVVELVETVAVIDVGGVGYEVEVTTRTAANLAGPGPASAAAPVVLHTHLIAREDAQTLYGFETAAERDMFRALIKVAGVGPRLAIALLSTVSPAEFSAAVAGGNVAAITRVQGIGKRTAERLVVEMRDKVDALAAAVSNGGVRSADREAVEALVALGYRDGEAASAVAAVLEAADSEKPSVEQLVTAALQSLARP